MLGVWRKSCLVRLRQLAISALKLMGFDLPQATVAFCVQLSGSDCLVIYVDGWLNGLRCVASLELPALMSIYLEALPQFACLLPALPDCSKVQDSAQSMKTVPSRKPFAPHTR